MTDTTNKVLEHYSAVGLTGRIQSALAAIAPESQTLTVAQLAPLDQFHLRGILATSELANATGIEPSAASVARLAILQPPSVARSRVSI
jgi:hypothetical protein